MNLDPKDALLLECAEVLKLMNGHSCTCSGCVSDERKANELVERIKKEVESDT